MDYLQNTDHKLKKFKIRQSFKESIEPEEILLDAEKRADYIGQKIEIPLERRIFIIFFGIIIFGLAVLAGRVGYFQFFKSDSYLKLAENNSIRSYLITPPRGLIYDQNLKPLVANIPSWRIYLTPQDLPKEKLMREDVINQISDILSLAPKEIIEQLDEFDFEKQQRILIADNIAPEKILGIESRLKSLPAVNLEKGIARQYLYGQAFSHLIGYTGKLSKEDFSNFHGYGAEEHLGRDGLESQYEKILRGQPGFLEFEVDALGRQFKELATEEPKPGQNIVTNIDSGLQKKLFEEVSQMVDSLNIDKAAAVAINPRNGKILSLVSLPSFDNNFFENNTFQTEVKKIINDIDAPLLNRVIAGQYPPGSTIKPLLGAAALEEKIVVPSTTINDTGSINIVNQFYPSIVYNYLDWKAHGTVNIYSAIAQSCNVYFYTIGGGHGEIKGLGIDRIKKYLNFFGLGQTTSIDLLGEESGLVPDSDWKKKYKSEEWFIGDTYHVSIGQGDLLVTPLQMASAISVIANGGKLYAPYIVDKIIDSDKNSINVFQPKIIRENFIKPENLAVIRKGMRDAVTSGSAIMLNNLNIDIAGKTGTAQVAGQERENAWFVGFAPYNDPEIVLVIILENAGEGSSYAVPIAKEVFKWYFNR